MRYLQYTYSLIKDVYIHKYFIHHAASLHQTFVHCGRFSTAATRRCMGRVSVPSVGARLSPPLSVIALVSHYLTNQLILFRPIQEQNTLLQSLLSRDHLVLVDLSIGYSRLLGMFLNITTSFATKLSHFHINSIIVLLLKLCLCFRVINSVRLACLIHAASVHPELGSNSKNKNGAKEICIILFL